MFQKVSLPETSVSVKILWKHVIWWKQRKVKVSGIFSYQIFSNGIKKCNFTILINILLHNKHQHIKVFSFLLFLVSTCARFWGFLPCEGADVGYTSECSVTHYQMYQFYMLLYRKPGLVVTWVVSGSEANYVFSLAAVLWCIRFFYFLQTKAFNVSWIYFTFCLKVFQCCIKYTWDSTLVSFKPNGFFSNYCQ